MRNLYDYYYLRLYQLMKKTPGRRTADDAALMLLLIALFFYTSPFLFFAIDYVFGKVEFWIWVLSIGLYSSLIFFANKKYFIDGNRLSTIEHKFSGESVGQRQLRGAIVILIELFSFIAFFLFLRFLF